MCTHLSRRDCFSSDFYLHLTDSYVRPLSVQIIVEASCRVFDTAMIKHALQALSAYPNSTIHLHHDVWLGHLDIASSPAVQRPFLVDIAGMTAKYQANLTAVAISFCVTAYTVISEVTEKLDRAFLTICHATPLLWQLKLAAAFTITPHEAQLQRSAWSCSAARLVSSGPL